MNDKSLLISVIIPVYKVEKYLEKCIESILAQTYANLEVILIDDGSPDNCPAICDKYAARDNRIKVIHRANGGLSAARNSGIKLARGGYIGFVDSDDYIESDMYEKLLRAALAHESEIAVCAVAKEYRDKTKTSGYETGIFDADTALEALVRYNGMGANSVWNKLYKAELFQDCLFPEGRIYEDMLTTYKLFAKANSVTVIPDVLYHYVFRETSIIRNDDKNQNVDRIATLLERADILAETRPDIADDEYEKVADLCMLACVKVRQTTGKDETLYKRIFSIFEDSLEKLKRGNRMKAFRNLKFIMYGKFPQSAFWEIYFRKKLQRIPNREAA